MTFENLFILFLFLYDSNINREAESWPPMQNLVGLTIPYLHWPDHPAFAFLPRGIEHSEIVQAMAIPIVSLMENGS